MLKCAFSSSVITAISEAIDPSNKIWVVLNSPSYVSGDVVTGSVEMVNIFLLFMNISFLLIISINRIALYHSMQEESFSK